MAKMFYTLEEAAERLGKNADAVREMAKSGQIQEFRDRDKLVFKVDQIDLLAHGEDDAPHDDADMSSMIPLADDDGGTFDDVSFESGGDLMSLEESSPGSLSGKSAAAASDEFSLADSSLKSRGGSAGALNVEPIEGDTKERTGVSIFDADELDVADPSALTQMSDEGGFGDMPLDSLGSGSGLLDLTRESDDTSLGAEFLDELAGADEGTVDRDAPGGGLFDTGGEAAPADAGAPVFALAAEPIDAAGSGLTAGLAIGAVLVLMIGLTTAILSLMDVRGNPLVAMLADNFLVIFASLAGAAVVLGVLGFVLGKRAG